MSSITPCNTSSLSVYNPSPTDPWNTTRIKHLYRRIGYGASKSVIEEALSKNPATLVDELIDKALAIPPTPAPEWAYKSFGDYPNQLVFDEMNQEHKQDAKYQFTENLLTQGLKSRMILFWMNHFVTQDEVYNCAGYLFQYYDLLQRNAFGNFKEFTSSIGKTPAMLHYLNGFDNTKEAPNENYARELYELFTLGENNGYTQQDIEETAKALTGFNSQSDYCGAITFNQNNTFDSSEKTIFGQVGTWGYDDVIAILFEQKESLIANYICNKLYTFFVSPIPSEAIVSQMATTFINNNFAIEPVLRQLFKSEHFFDEASFGMLIKSPIDLTHQFLVEMEYPYTEDGLNTVRYINNILGQNVFQPIDVAGWQGDHDWISSSTLTGRWVMMEWVIWPVFEADKRWIVRFVKDLTDNSIDPYFITKTVIDYYMTKELASDGDYEIANVVFKGDFYPENYYTEGTWNLDFENTHWQLLNLLYHIIKMPEFQLK